ncbi:MAG: LuxR C-terminal-related transcriptional regulator [Sphingobacteriales bacterium]
MNSKEPVRIALADDNFVCRNSFLQKAQMIPEWKIVFVSEDSDDCMKKLSSLKESTLPQIVFMDIEMPVVSGSQTIAMAKAIYPQIYFIALTVFDEDDKIFEAIKAGACGYLLKHEEHTVLKEAVTNVLEYGGSPMSPAIARKALQLLGKAYGIAIKEHGSIPDNISPRENEILQYTVKGWDAKRIAVHLSISVLTVRKHIANIYEKLHVQSKAEIINMAHKNNWIR